MLMAADTMVASEVCFFTDMFPDIGSTVFAARRRAYQAQHEVLESVALKLVANDFNR